MHDPIWDENECSNRDPLRAYDLFWDRVEIATLCAAVAWIIYRVSPHFIGLLLEWL